MKMKMMEKSDCIKIGNRLRKFRKKLGFTCNDFAKKIDRNRSYISGIENGYYSLSPRLIEAIENKLKIQLKNIFSETEWNENDCFAISKIQEDSVNESIRRVPVIGETEAGFPRLFCGDSIENLSQNCKTIAVSNFVGEDIFALKVNGFSMAPRILPDDVIILSSTRQAKQGDLCVAVNIDNESTLKVLDSADDSVVLKPLNPQYKVLVYERTQIMQILPVISILATPQYT